MLGRIGTRCQLAFDGRFGQDRRIGDQRVDRVDAGVEVVLERIEVAVVAVGDLGRNRALGDLVDVVGGHVERPDHRVECGIDTLDDRLKITLVLGRVGPRFKLAFDRGLGEHVGVCSHGLNRRLHPTHCIGQPTDLILAVDVEFEAKVPGGHFVGAIRQLSGRAGDAARDKEGKKTADQKPGSRQCNQQPARRRRQSFRLSANLFVQLGLIVDEVAHRLHIGVVVVAHILKDHLGRIPLLGLGRVLEFCLQRDICLSFVLQCSHELLALLAILHFVQFGQRVCNGFS